MIKLNISKPPNYLITIFLIYVILTGCTGQTVVKPETSPEQRFDRKTYRLIEEIVSLNANTPMALAPVAVMSGSVKRGRFPNRLEEHVMDRLQLRLRKDQDIYFLTRENWFEYRESQPLETKSGRPSGLSSPDYMLIYEVGTSMDEVLRQIRVQVVATDISGIAVPGLVAEAVFESEPENPAYRLYHARAAKNPYPEGLEERPFQSIDRLSYSLSSELIEAYGYGLTAGHQTPEENEVRIVLYTNPTENVPHDVVRRIQDSLQQAVVRKQGFTCAVSQKDLGPFFMQVDFYKHHRKLFQLEESPLAAGTVLMMVDVFQHPDKDKIGVAVRAAWSVNPLVSTENEIIKNNVAGTYVSGFTAKAYMHVSPHLMNRPVRRLHAGFE